MPVVPGPGLWDLVRWFCCSVRVTSCGQAGPASTRNTGRCHTPRLSADYCLSSPVVYACGVHGPHPSPCVSLVSSSRQCVWSCVSALPLMLTFTGIVLPRHCSPCAACLVVSGSPVVIAESAAWLAVETEWPYFCGGSYACATFTDCARLWSDCCDTYGVNRARPSSDWRTAGYQRIARSGALPCAARVC